MRVISFACPLTTTRIGDFETTLKTVEEITIIDGKLVIRMYTIYSENLPNLSEENRKAMVAKVLPKLLHQTQNENYVIALTEDGKYQCASTDECHVYSFYESYGVAKLLKVHKRVMLQIATDWQNGIRTAIQSGDYFECTVINNEIIELSKIDSGQLS